MFQSEKINSRVDKDLNKLSKFDSSIAHPCVRSVYRYSVNPIICDTDESDATYLTFDDESDLSIRLRWRITV